MALATAALLTLTTGACVGSVTRETFDAEVRERGGGLSQDTVLDAVVAVADDQATDPVQLRSITISPARVSMEVRVPGSAEDVDAYAYGTSGLYGGRGLDGPTPVARSSTETPLESSVFTAEAAGVRVFDRMVDSAIEEADLPGGYATGATVRRPSAGAEPLTTVTVTDERRTVTVTLSPTGAVTGVQR